MPGASAASRLQTNFKLRDDSNMYAVIETGGKQYRVGLGQRLRVETLPAESGATVALDRVLMVADGEAVQVGTPVLDGAQVEAEVLGHGRGDKILVFKKKRRKNYRRRMGHRQNFTELRITRIGDSIWTAPEPTAPEAEAAPAETPVEADTDTGAGADKE